VTSCGKPPMNSSGLLLLSRAASSGYREGLVIGACSGRPPAALSIRGAAALRRPFVFLSAWWSENRSRPFSFSSASRRFDAEWVEYPIIMTTAMDKTTASRATTQQRSSRQAPQCPLSGRVRRRSDNRITLPRFGERFLKSGQSVFAVMLGIQK